MTLGIAFFYSAVAAPPPPSGPILDPYTTGLWSCVGLKQLLTSYGGALIRVRRSSDNAEQDINSITGGGLDTASLLSFVGSGDGFVSVGYDQSGSGNDFAAPSSNQPAIVLSGSYLGTIRFQSASSSYLESSNQMPAGGGRTTLMNSQLRSVSAAEPLVFTGNVGAAGHNTIAQQYQLIPALIISYDISGAFTSYSQHRSFPIVTLTDYGMCTTYDNTGGNAVIYFAVNGSSSGSDFQEQPVSNFTAENIYIGADPGTPIYADIDVKFFALWNTKESSANANAISALT